MRNRTILLILAAAVLMSCSPVHVRMFPGAHRFPPTSPDRVDLLRREPPRPHIAFAEIVYTPDRYANRREVDWVLRDRAARIGADALVIEVDTFYREPVWAGPSRQNYGHPYQDRTIVGVAIRYRR
jgi:hypothetical protein